MTTDDKQNVAVDQLLEMTGLADALESDRFKQFLDHIPIAIAVSELGAAEAIVYANLEFERLLGVAARDINARGWDIFPETAIEVASGKSLSDAIGIEDEYLGTFTLQAAGAAIRVDAWSNVIADDHARPAFRLVALAEAVQRSEADEAALRLLLQDKDVLLRELQHRVNNNLQMITSLIRLESRTIPDNATTARFDRLAGRIEALGLLYRSLSEAADRETIDLGIYLSEIAAAVMHAHATEGIHLNLQIDTWPVSVNVAMPTGLVVNELLTNALKHAFVGREGGTITLHSLVDDTGCTVVVADDGVGIVDPENWPRPGKLSAMIVQSLRQNAKARLDVASTPGEGTQISIFFARADATESPGSETSLSVSQTDH